MNFTSIEWTDYSSNPLAWRSIVTGKRVPWCVKISPGCALCYSAAHGHRFGGPEFHRHNATLVEPYFAEHEVRALLRANTTRAWSKVFIEDMTDLFLDLIPNQMIARLFAVMGVCDDLTFQVLTKRADRMRALLSDGGFTAAVAEEVERVRPLLERTRGDWSHVSPLSWALAMGEAWPLPNVWLGVSVEDQARADERMGDLIRTPNVLPWVSYEPALGPVDWTPWLADFELGRGKGKRNLRWIVVGGQSGRGARAFDLDWARSTIQQCRAAKVPVFVKQLGASIVARNDAVADWFEACGHLDLSETERFQGAEGRVLGFRDRKGGDPSEWPEELRVREMPRVAAGGRTP